MHYDRPLLTFSMRLPIKAEERLIVGMLYLQQKDKLQLQFNCTSGARGFQFKQAQHLVRRGPIPSTAKLDGIYYSVETRSIRMTVPGHEGASFHPIRPSSVKIHGVIRGEFGIHRDLNAPGTAGCLGIPDQESWYLFTGSMIALARKGIECVPLRVLYH